MAAILQHEGLAQGQTPFRITNPAMAKWSTVHGYKTSRAPKPRGRENFLFLQNPMEVFPAVQRQFENYYRYPERYDLRMRPTVAQAVKVFDQSGSQGKLEYLRQRGIDPEAELASIFEEAS